MRTDFYSLLPVTVVHRANGSSFTAVSVEQISSIFSEKNVSIDDFIFLCLCRLSRTMATINGNQKRSKIHEKIFERKERISLLVTITIS